MADWLLLRFPHQPDQLASWLVVDARGAPVGAPQSGPLSMAAERSAGRHICVLVPSSEVLLAEPEVPAKAGAKLQQLVPFALEEQVADDIDDLHFAIGKRAGDSVRTPVAVVARSLMDEWIATLKGNGIEPEAMYVESELLPENPGQSVALLEDDTVVIRPPSGMPVTLPTDALGDALSIAQSAGASGDGSGRGLILYTGAAEWHRYSPAVEAVREYFEGIKIQLLTNGPLALFGQQIPITSPINLLQGPYAPTTSRAVGFRAWRVAATLFVCLVGLHVAGKAAELTMLKRSEKKLDSAISDTFHMAMPGEQSTADARHRMEQRLAAARNGSDSSGMLAALEALVQARNLAPGAVLKAMSFRDGALDLKVSAPDASSLDRLSQNLRNTGWQADLMQGSAAASGYEGRIQVRAK